MRKYLLTPEGKITETKTEVWVIISFVMPFFNLQIGLSTLPPLIPSLQHSHLTFYNPLSGVCLSHFIKLQEARDQ